MNKFVELPLAEPLFKTYHYQGAATATITANPSIRNWYLTRCADLMCTRKFLTGFTSPQISIPDSSWSASWCFEKLSFPMELTQKYTGPIIRELLEHGYYVAFTGVDDYYVRGKTWYKARHFSHDGLICGYNQEDKTYCMYAYDSSWIYRKFWTPQKGFNEGRMARAREGEYGEIFAFKPKKDPVPFIPDIALDHISGYLNPSASRYPNRKDGSVYGMVVQEYIAEYLTKLEEGSIPYERMDRRVFCLIWEHKKVMLERMQALETTFGVPAEYSDRYKLLVTSADTLRMMYASHHLKRRDSILPVIRERLLNLMEAEREILKDFRAIMIKELKK